MPKLIDLLNQIDDNTLMRDHTAIPTQHVRAKRLKESISIKNDTSDIYQLVESKYCYGKVTKKRIICRHGTVYSEV